MFSLWNLSTSQKAKTSSRNHIHVPSQKEMLQKVQKEQDIGSCEQWLNIKNDQDYLHPVEKKPVAEFKEFEHRFKFKPRFKYGCFH